MKRFLLVAIVIFRYAALFAQPVNDSCNFATPIIIPSSGTTCVTGTLAGATDDGSYSGCEQAGSAEVWYSYISNGAYNSVTVSPNGGTPATNLAVTILSGGCNGAGYNACNSATGSGTATATWTYPQGTQVWIYISSNGGTNGGFQVCVNSYEVPPTNGSSCTTASPMCDMNSFSFPMPNNINGFQPPCFASAFQRPVIFSFSVAVGGLLNWRAIPTCNARTEFDWAVYDVTTGCASAVQVACNYNTTTGLFGIQPITAPQGMNGGPAAGCNVNTFIASAAAELCSGVNVVAGHTYVIMLDQFTNTSNCNIDFNFTGSTFQMAPTSSFVVAPNTGCGSVTATFTNNSAGVVSQTWSFGDSTTSTVVNPPTKTYSVPGTYLISLSTISGNGCTDVSSQSITVKPQPTVTANNATACPGQPATVTATPSVNGGAYSWSPGGATTSSITVSPATTTTYTVTYTLNGCTATATATVTVRNATFTVNAGNDTTVCANQVIPLRTNVNPSGTYTYSWTPSGSVANPTLGTTTATVAATTNFVVAVTDTGGCVKSDTLLANVNGAGPQVTATANPTTVCPGQSTQLDVSLIPRYCGISNTCGDTTRAVIGTGTTNQPGTFAQAPTMFGNYTKSYRNQMLYTAAELNAAFGGPCVIKAIAFNISIYNNNQILENYTVKIGCTSATSLSAWDNSLLTVYTPKNFQPTGPGWQTLNFDNAYAWDGTSNLLVDVCWFNPNTSANANNKVSCTTTAANTYLYSDNVANQCGINGAFTATNLRPNARFTYCNNQISNYTIAWTANPTSTTVSNSAIRNPTSNLTTNTTYSVTLSSSGCSGTGTVNVLVDTSRVNAGTDVSTCPGVSTTLTANAIGSPVPGPASYSWTTLSGTAVGNTPSITVSPSVTTGYIVAMNGGACVKRDTVFVNIGSLSFTRNVTPISCSYLTDGRIRLIPNGSSPYSYNWSANAATGNVDSAVALGPGIYYATITDGIGCIARDTVTLTAPTAVSFTTAVTNVSCFGGNNGSITATPTGGTGPGYTYQWSNSATGSTNATLVAGTYTLTLHDANSCSATGSATVNQPTQIVLQNPAIVNVRCFNGNTGSIAVSATGGTGSYNYSWSHQPGLNNASAGTLVAGNYTVTIVDANGCTATATYIVTQPASGLVLNAPTVSNVSCFGGGNGSITLQPSGGATPYIYSWSGGVSTTVTASNLTAQSYTVTVTDDSLCAATATIAVSQPTQVLVSGVVTSVSCFGGSNGAIDITASQGTPGYTYNWSNTSTSEDVNSLTQGSYQVTVSDLNSCTQTATFTVNQPQVLALNPPVIVNVSCFGGSNGQITSSATGGTGSYTYSWTPANSGSTISALSSGSYAVTVTDVNSCSASATYAVTEPANAVSFSNPTITDLLCNGVPTGSISVSASGGTGAISYSWSHNASLQSSIAQNLPAGNYTVTATDLNGCTATAQYSVNEPSAIVFGNSVITPVSCFGLSDGTATLNVSGGTGAYNYLWNNNPGNNPQTGLRAGNYNVVVTDANGCSASTSLVINQPAQISVSLTPTSLTCSNAANGQVAANVSGGTSPYQYNWSVAGSGSVITGLSAGAYLLTVTDFSGCSVSASTNVTEPALLTVNASSTQVSCNNSSDGTITAFGNGGTAPYTFNLYRGGQLLQSNFTGAFIGLSVGGYQLDVVDFNGCSNTTSIVVPSPVSDLFLLTTDSTSCYGSQYSDGAAFITGLTLANQPYRYSIDGGPLQYSGDFYGLRAGNHIIRAVNNFGCDTNISFIVLEPAQATLEVNPNDTIIQLGQSIRLYSTFAQFPLSSIVSYNWSPSEGLDCSDCPNPLVSTYNRSNQYTLVVTYNNGCTVTAGSRIFVQNNLDTYIPNAFTPNGDGNNDIFTIYGLGIREIDMKIFNRWGELVFVSTNQQVGWDGTYKGALQNPGVFVYYVRLTYLDGKEVSRTGSLTLVR